jgi:hypothetical protein
MEVLDPIRKLQLNVRNSCAAKSRIGTSFKVIRGAAETMPTAALCERRRRT